MNRYIAHYFFLLFFTFSITFTNAQIEIRPLEYNPEIKKLKPRFEKSFRADSKWDSVSYDLTKKGFFDDFSYNGAYPSDSFWLDDDVFINNSLPIRPVSLGVATFDGLNAIGNPYDPGAVNSKGKVADYLTSVPIDLSVFEDSDSIYLSFFFQPQGLGDAPEYYDSLVLEFRADSFFNGVWTKDAWVWRWSESGTLTQDFKQVIVRIPKVLKDTNGSKIAGFYHDRFQFRFKNYAALDGNRDLWHLDYVLLDKGRTYNDFDHNDLAINEFPNSILDDYTSMPWDHVLADKTQIRNVYNMHLWNNWKLFRHLTAQYFFVDYYGGDTVLEDLTADDKDIYPGGAIQPIYFTLEDDFPLNEVDLRDTVVVQSILKSALFDDRIENNVAINYQEFANYYAYDDGIPEMGFGFTEGTKYGMVAYKFQMPDGFPTSDSLRGVKFFFNQSSDNTSARAFNILVWKDYQQEPLLTIETNIPNFSTTETNGYFEYIFDTTIFLDGTFYIGWEQFSNFYINVGYDKNYYLLHETEPLNTTNENIKAYFNGSWKTIGNATGALMIRPIFDDHDVSVGVQKNKMEDENLSLFPNPVYSNLFLRSDRQIGQVEIYDIQGKLIVSDFGKQEIDLSNLGKRILYS
jgi:hypothetical protein